MRRTLHSHIYHKDSMDKYILRNKHGEPRVLFEDEHEVVAFEDEPTDEAEENAAEEK